METIELSDFTLTEIPPDVVLYNETLCEKVNNKFKKVTCTILNLITATCAYVGFSKLLGKLVYPRILRVRLNKDQQRTY